MSSYSWKWVNDKVMEDVLVIDPDNQIKAIVTRQDIYLIDRDEVIERSGSMMGNYRHCTEQLQAG